MNNEKISDSFIGQCGEPPIFAVSSPSYLPTKPVLTFVDTFVPCDPNMYSHLCTEIYLSLFTALD